MNAPLPIQHRPFNLEHARAGAPYVCADGYPAHIQKWDARGGAPGGNTLLGYIEGNISDYPCKWNSAGRRLDKTVSLGVIESDSLVMTPLGYIDGKPVFVGDRLEQRDRHNEAWIVRDAQPTDRDFSTSRWPAPEHEYPQTLMDNDTLFRLVDKRLFLTDNARIIANAALRHAIDQGQVVEVNDHAETVRKAYADGQAIAYKHEAASRAARDMAVAEAVRDACQKSLKVGVASVELVGDLAAIIAEVKP